MLWDVMGTPVELRRSPDVFIVGCPVERNPATGKVGT